MQAIFIFILISRVSNYKSNKKFCDSKLFESSRISRFYNSLLIQIKNNTLENYVLKNLTKKKLHYIHSRMSKKLYKKFRENKNLCSSFSLLTKNF